MVRNDGRTNLMKKNGNVEVKDITNLFTGELLRTEVFTEGEDGCHTYRIPAVTQAGNGTILAFAEGRRDNAEDPGGGHIDLVCKSSNDGGQTWSSRFFIDRSLEGWSASNPTVVAARGTDRIYLFFNRWKPGCGGRNSRAGSLDNQLWMTYSDDNGESWSAAEDITRQGRNVERWGKAVFGPGHGMETSAGRLVVPVNAPFDAGEAEQTASFAIYSDDKGKTWKRGQQIKAWTNENQIAELDDGRLLMDARQGANLANRWNAFSDNGGKSWSEPEPGQVVPGICTSLARYNKAREAGDSIFLWSGLNPGIPHAAWAYPSSRKNLVLRLSADQCRSFPVELLIGPGPAGYSDLCVLKDGSVGVLWEGGKTDYREKVFFTRLPPAITQTIS